jgi:hypothetical protein
VFLHLPIPINHAIANVAMNRTLVETSGGRAVVREQQCFRQCDLCITVATGASVGIGALSCRWQACTAPVCGAITYGNRAGMHNISS